MRIGVNLTPLIPGKTGGLRQHALGLLTRLLALDGGHEYLCYVRRNHDRSLFPTHPRLRLVDIPRGPGEIERRIYAGDVDVMFACLMDRGTQAPACPTVSLLPDLQHVDHPEHFPVKDRQNRELYWGTCARSSQRVAVSSDFVRHRVAEHLLISDQRFVHAPPPIQECFLTQASPQTLAGFQSLRARLPERYLLYPANTWHHKNHIRLLQAVARVGTGGDVVHLVLTGWREGAHRDVIREIQRLGLTHRVHWLGYIADEMLPLVYAEAVALVYPSLYEGYGIPLIEAMYMGCPVLCSNVTSCPEVVRNAALMFDPLDVEMMRDAIERVWSDAGLRESLREAGRRRAAEIDPYLGARNLLMAFQQAIEEYEDPRRWHWVEGSTPPDADVPLVSIITPSYQQGAFIRETIESIRTQDYPRIEHIVVDGGSTDGTVEILRSYGDSLRWVSESDHGQAHAVNKGLAMARGEIIGWLNSDDTYLSGAISKAVAALRKPSGCWAAYGEAYYTDEHGSVTRRYATETYSVQRLLCRCFICQPAVFFHRRLLDLAGTLDERYEMAMDYEFWLRCSKITPFLYIPAYLATSRLYASNKTSRFRMRSVRESMRACRAHYGQTSLPWCREYAFAMSDRIAFLKRWKKLRTVVRLVLFLYAWARSDFRGTLREMLRPILAQIRA
jgi:glycosyltransferase involved in cell wall biosynthesis